MTAPATDNSLATAMRKMSLLLSIAAALWLVLAGPAYMLRGTLALEGLSYAVLMCLVPGWLVVYVTTRYPEAGSQATAVLLGTGLRMAFVLIGMVMLRDLRPELGHYEFQLWVILSYLAFLAVETVMIVKYTQDQEG